MNDGLSMLSEPFDTEEGAVNSTKALLARHPGLRWTIQVEWPDGAAMNDPAYREIHYALQKLWTQYAGTDGYVKADWVALDNLIAKAWRARWPGA